ncbi:hypothetical protein F5Y14DRAFT_436625 [Nemania sp. NC0429]|nr:hypothetical protein F5Y14DRAFT_436625 [Nemania sp. NC0429]
MHHCSPMDHCSPIDHCAPTDDGWFLTTSIMNYAESEAQNKKAFKSRKPPNDRTQTSALLASPGTQHKRSSTNNADNDQQPPRASLLTPWQIRWNAPKPTRLRRGIRRGIRRCIRPLLLAAHEVKAFKKCWSEFKNKEKLFQPEEYEQMAEKGQWFEFPSPENIKWLWVTTPQGVRQVNGTHNRHWGPDLILSKETIHFSELDGRVV